MSVVLDIDMPSSCAECLFYKHLNKQCRALIGYTDLKFRPSEYWATGRPKNCPIVCELPKGHGRLVDSKLLEKDMDTIWFSDKSLCKDVYSVLDDAPTVVEADSEVTE